MMGMTIIILLIFGTMFIIGLYLSVVAGRLRNGEPGIDAGQRCPSCGVVARPGSEFCPRCGQRL